MDESIIFYYPSGPSGINAYYERSTPLPKNIEIKIDNLGSYTYSKRIYFNWSTPSNVLFDYVRITVSSQNNNLHRYYAYETNHFVIEVDKLNCFYEFTIEPIVGKQVGPGLRCERFISQTLNVEGVPTVKIITGRQKDTDKQLKFVWPTCDYVSSPTGWGGSIKNNNYVTNSTILVFDSKNSLISAHSKAKVKLRGNSTAYAPKKPYKIKLDVSEDFLHSFLPNRDDSFKHKEWILLPKGDQLLDYTGFLTSKHVGQEYTPSCFYINLIINGEYQGCYLLTESIDRGEKRINVADDGFIFENDGLFWNEDLYFETRLYTDSDKHVAYTLKYPDPDNLTENSAEVLYLKDLLTNFEKALYSNSQNDYSKYIDVESFAKWLLVHDYIGTWDSGGSNMYLYKNDSSSNSKIFAGPCWDFESATMMEVNEFARIRWGNHYYINQLFKKHPLIMLTKVYLKVITRVILILSKII